MHYRKYLMLVARGGALCLFLVIGSCVFDASGLSPDELGQCGNGVREPGEDCDGADLGQRTCASLNLGGGVLSCTAGCDYDVAGCEFMAQCGNGMVEGAEQCDDGNLTDGDGCSAQCLFEVQPGCGNGTVEPGEECDDGNASNEDGCLNTCRNARCGDGFLRQGLETCEPGLLGATCQTLGYAGGTLQCRADCTAYDTSDCTRGDYQDCTEAYQCDGGECYQEASTGWPAGYCTRACTSEADCGGGSCLFVEGVGNRCFQTCTGASDCRPGYGCFDPSNLGYTICWPHCEVNTECPDTGSCNPYLGRCDQPSQGSGAYGDACVDRSDCLGLCWTVGEGYCVSRCKLSTGNCPPDGVCTDVFEGAHGDEGLCLHACAPFGFDCRLGQSCQERYGQNVCWF